MCRFSGVDWHLVVIEKPAVSLLHMIEPHTEA
jgi:hypothetical protein